MPAALNRTVIARRPTLALALSCLVATGSAGPLLAAEDAGRVELVHVWAARTPERGPAQPLFDRYPVFFKDTLSTVRNAALHVTLSDGTALRLGEEATVTIDETILAAGDERSVVANLARGIGRFITARAAAGNLRVVTATATIGIRGTDFSVWVEADGRTTVWVNEGSVVVSPREGTPPAIVEQDATVAVAGRGLGVERDAVRPAPDPGLQHKFLIRR